MKFDDPITTVYENHGIESYFGGKCPLCGSFELSKRSSRERRVPDLGSPTKKVIAVLQIVTFSCQSCKMEFSPEHSLFPPKYEYSKAIITYALSRSHYHNASGNEITRDLLMLHQIEISPKTIYTWIDKLGPEFTKEKIDANPTVLPAHIKSITIDGTFVTMGKQLIGKKKDVESLSVTKLADDRYLLMWWE